MPQWDRLSFVITSYSIHYTKLYEVADDVPLTGGEEVQHRAGRRTQRDHLSRRAGGVHEVQAGLLVITSYSIHYTKLYDCKQDLLVLN